MRQRTARSLKWNVIDKLVSQFIYAATGIVLARELSQEAFGLVGAVLVFQTFASMFVDSGFFSALIQRKRPSELDYSSVFWFNILISCALYTGLWFAAPWIASLFGNDARLIPLCRVMFLSFVINASSLIQINRLVKQMNFKPLAIINVGSLALGGVVGVVLACRGAEAWALVWQTIAAAVAKTLFAWRWCRWMPLFKLSFKALRSYLNVGLGMMLTSFLNLLFQNIYSFFTGNRSGLKALGYYTQSDKWSKMGIMAVSQVLTSSFLPALAEVQDDPSRFSRSVAKMNRFTAYLLFPAMVFLIAMSTPMFHLLFGTKWDPSIALFQLLLVRGIFFVLTALYNNYLLSLGLSRKIFLLEVLRDCVAIAGIFATLPYITLTTPTNPVYGLEILLWGQVAASAVAWVATLVVAARACNTGAASFLRDHFPYFVLASAIGIPVFAVTALHLAPLPTLLLQASIAIILYVGSNAVLNSRIQSEIFSAIFRRKQR